MAKSKKRPLMIMADEAGNIYDHPDQLMVCSLNGQPHLPRPDEITSMPPGASLLLLPGRHPLGICPETGLTSVHEDLAVGAIVPPNYLVTAQPAWEADEVAPSLPKLALASVGFAEPMFYICACNLAPSAPQPLSAKQSKAMLKKLSENFLHNPIINYLMGQSPQKSPFLIALAAQLPELIFPTWGSPSSPANPLPGEESLPFQPKPSDLASIMLWHAEKNQQPRFHFGGTSQTHTLSDLTSIIDASTLFLKQNKTGTIVVRGTTFSEQELAALHAGGIHEFTLKTLQLWPHTTDEQAIYKALEATLTAVQALNATPTLQLAFLAGYSDTEKELESLIQLIKRFNIQALELTNRIPAITDNLQTNSPILGFANFRKRLRLLYPSLAIRSVPFAL